MKVSFLINNIYGIGGTNRTVINLAEALSARHEVEIVSVFRRAGTTKFEISPQVSVRALVDLRAGAGADRGADGLAEPTSVVPRQEEFYAQYSRLSDERIIDHLRKTDADVVIGTRPSLNLFVARFTRDSALRVAQEHMTHLAIPPAVREEMARVYPRLDAITTVTDADARSFRENTPIDGVPVTGIPNSVPQPVVAPSDGSRKIVVSAGRIHHVKRYDLLVRAFGQIAEEFPEWQLRIYGDGAEAGKLRALVTDLGLTGRALLMGGFSPIESEWAKGSIAAVTSSAESFGMTLVEAMRCGLPVVSTDCPVGPREILRDGEDGLLVPNGDVDAIAGGLRRLMADDALRVAMGTAALHNSARYDPAVIADRYTDLFEDAAERRAARDTKYRTPKRKPLRRGSGSDAPPAAVRTSVVHTVADETGRLRLTVDGPEDGRQRWSFRLRHATGGDDRRPDLDLATDRAPLPTGATRYTATLPPSALDHLGDGRWRVQMVSAKGEAVHMKAGIRDTRALITARARLLAFPEHSPVRWNLPYAQPNGKLMLRTVLRDEHVECRELTVTDDSITARGVLCAARQLAPDARFLLVRRGHHRAEIAAPARRLGAHEFTVELPLRQLVDVRLERWEDWDWWLQPDPRDRRRLRVCHLFEDFPDVKGSYVHPVVPVPDELSPFVVVHPSRPVRVRPYTSVSGAMAVNVVDR
ncbi:glycosyltransferase family 4 protein [Streptomyces roseolus]|uniref:glycosyltransferase family 4 protein n=1 Tax=Streptomyces roseolus TaxID=67358 RepID=UPI0036E84A4C